jgi:alpha-glucosidase (family GH31 glycosyl hydrolase)
VYKKSRTVFVGVLLLLGGWSSYSRPLQTGGASFTVQAGNLRLTFDGLFFETSRGRVNVPVFSTPVSTISDKVWVAQSTMADGRSITAIATVLANRYTVSFKAIPDSDITGWGIAVDSNPDEYYTGLMERVVDGPQQASWAPGITAAMNLRGQKIDMIAKPTTSVYAPFYISSRGYAIFVRGTWPGVFDFASENKQRVEIAFEGPSFEMSVYADSNPAALVRAHAMDAGPPVLPPKWMFGPWRWRDEHTQRTKYYDGTPVTGPFNSEVMEDVLMMQAFGIPNSVYWIDRPWGPGPLGYDDFKIDEQRLPNFGRMVQWLDSQRARTMLWIAPFFQGEMAVEAQAKKYTLAGQVRPPNGNNYPMVDLTNPDAKAYWQNGVAKLLKLGVAGFKLDRSEENIPDNGPDKVFDQRSIRENRNAYPAMYVQAAADIARKYRGDDFIVMPRAAYTGSSAYGVFWGGDIGGTQEGLRASIIAVQRAAVMGYPNWGSDTCGYNQQLMEQEVCGRWLEFSAFTPIMEVGPTRNVAFWNAPRPPEYDDVLIAIWRLYARVHQNLADYSYRLAQEAHRTGMPIVRPLFLADPNNPEAWKNWWTYLYGPDLVVSPIWEKGVTTQSVYLPSGSRWRDAWNPDKTYKGGQTIMVRAAAHQIPLFIRDGSSLKLGDLNKEWQDSVAIAKTKPDLKTLDAGVKNWFEKN